MHSRYNSIPALSQYLLSLNTQNIRILFDRGRRFSANDAAGDIVDIAGRDVSIAVDFITAG